MLAKEKIPYGIQRYVGETERLYGILDARLRDRDYVVGAGRGRYSIADIALLGWVNGIERLSVSLDQFPSIRAWLERVLARPAVLRGLNVPDAEPKRATALDEIDDKTKSSRAELKKLVDAAKKQYGYKYASP